MPVAARFHEIRDRVVAAVDKAFAEPLRLLPLKGRGQEPDSARAVAEFDAVLRVGGGKETNVSGGQRSSWRSKLAAGRAELHLDRVLNPTVVVQVGDKIVALSRHEEPIFEVLRVDDRGDSRLVLELGEV